MASPSYEVRYLTATLVWRQVARYTWPSQPCMSLSPQLALCSAPENYATPMHVAVLDQCSVALKLISQPCVKQHLLNRHSCAEGTTGHQPGHVSKTSMARACSLGSQAGQKLQVLVQQGSKGCSCVRVLCQYAELQSPLVPGCYQQPRFDAWAQHLVKDHSWTLEPADTEGACSAICGGSNFLYQSIAWLKTD